MSSSQATEKEGMVQCLTDIFDNFRLDIEAIAYWHNSDKKKKKTNQKIPISRTGLIRGTSQKDYKRKYTVTKTKGLDVL